MTRFLAALALLSFAAPCFAVEPEKIDLFEGGSVLLPKAAPWLDAFVSELLSFPGRHDDQVDALTQGLAWRREAWRAPLVQRRAIGLGG